MEAIKTVTSERQQKLLAVLAKGIDAIGGRVGDEPDSLRVHFPMPDGSEVEVDFSFVTDFVGGQAYDNLQVHAFIHDQIDLAATPDLLWLVTQVNRYLPIGAFGVLHDLEMLYWKQNIIVDPERKPARNVALLHHEIRIAMASISDFWTTFHEVVAQQSDAKTALAKNKWGPVLFGL